VKSVSGEKPQLPRTVLERVVAHARQLGRDVASDDLFLLALTELDETLPARQALALENVDAARLLAEIRTSADRPGSERGLTFSPASYAMHGRAEGFAASLGDGKIAPEHVLLAVIWDPTSRSSHMLWRLGVSRERIIERLRELGAQVPEAPLLPQREIEWGERVWFGRGDVRRVLDQLRLHIPPGTEWGFNYEGDRAWAHAEAHIDVEALVNAALAGY
jgi:Clp amino terminal domain, pathogenicity island component